MVPISAVLAPRSAALVWRLFLFSRQGSVLLTMQPQQQTQWCWSAVATSVSLFYDSASGWTQCALVDAELGQTSCCVNGGTPTCNQPWFLDLALTRTGNLDPPVGGVATFAVTANEIDAGQPVGVRIGWSGGGGHFVVIAGYTELSLSRWLAMRDPWFGNSSVGWSGLQTSYQGTGSWTHTNNTQA